MVKLACVKISNSDLDPPEKLQEESQPVTVSTTMAKKTVAAAHRHLDYLRGWVPKGSGHTRVPAPASGDSWFSSWGDSARAAPASRYRSRSRWEREATGRGSAAGAGGDSWYESWVRSE